jgi:hypothetical protein
VTARSGLRIRKHQFAAATTPDFRSPTISISSNPAWRRTSAPSAPMAGYDPARHYMRGPGPKASSKQKPSR